MNCQRAARKMVDYVEGVLRPRDAEKVSRHLLACPRCATEERALRALGSNLRAALGGAESPARLTTRVIETIRAEQRRAAGGTWKPSWAAVLLAGTVLLAGLRCLTADPEIGWVLSEKPARAALSVQERTMSVVGQWLLEQEFVAELLGNEPSAGEN